VKTAQKYEVIIIGGGPGGMSAAVWCADLGLRSVLVERSNKLGGQLAWVHNPVTNYLGINAKNGTELATKFEQHVLASGIEIASGCEVDSADLLSKTVDLGDRALSCDAVIIATGVRRRKLGIPGEDLGAERGVLASGVRDRERVLGKRVVIVGGGDAALENALLLSEMAEHVTIIHRGEKFKARPDFENQLGTRNNVSLVLNSELTAITAEPRVRSAHLQDLVTNKRSELDCDAVLVRIGVEPNSDLFHGQLELDDQGYIIRDVECRTSVPGVYAIGDVANQGSPTISTACGTAATAAKVIAGRRP
jgi:thioredoxin reductase (NADPH)